VLGHESGPKGEGEGSKVSKNMTNREGQSKIDELSEQRARLQASLATGRRWIAKAQQKSQDLDQLCAARKDARGRGRQQGEHTRQGGPDDLATATPPPDPGCADRKRLLILVEDNPDDRRLFQRALQKAGVTDLVRWAGEGTKAIEMLSHLGPENASVCLVSASKLPDMSGFELLEKVRAMDLLIPVRFVFLTGDTQPSMECHAHASGADAFFVKPCLFENLIGIARAIAKLLANSPEVAR
jgi:two-component system, response regulator